MSKGCNRHFQFRATIANDSVFDTFLLFCHNREHSAGELFSKRGDALIEFVEDKNFALGQHTFENRNFVVETNVVYA